MIGRPMKVINIWTLLKFLKKVEKMWPSHSNTDPADSWSVQLMIYKCQPKCRNCLIFGFIINSSIHLL